MSKCVFPAVFQWDPKENVYYVNFPDMDGCFTDGATLAEAMENAEDVLNLMIWSMEHEKQVIPPKKFSISITGIKKKLMSYVIEMKYLIMLGSNILTVTVKSIVKAG